VAQRSARQAFAPRAVTACRVAGEFGLNKGWVMSTGFATNIVNTLPSDDVGDPGPDKVSMKLVFNAAQQAVG
jgi:hypothetical protein